MACAPSGWVRRVQARELPPSQSACKQAQLVQRNLNNLVLAKLPSCKAGVGNLGPRIGGFQKQVVACSRGCYDRSSCLVLYLARVDNLVVLAGLAEVKVIQSSGW